MRVGLPRQAEDVVYVVPRRVRPQRIGSEVVSIKAHILPFISVRAYLACIYERVIGIWDLRAQVFLQISLALLEVESCVQLELPFTRNASRCTGPFFWSLLHAILFALCTDVKSCWIGPWDACFEFIV